MTFSQVFKQPGTQLTRNVFFKGKKKIRETFIIIEHWHRKFKLKNTIYPQNSLAVITFILQIILASFVIMLFLNTPSKYFPVNIIQKNDKK